MPGVNIGTNMPSKSVAAGKHYTNITFDASTGLVVAASSLQCRFGLYDEDGNSAWERDGACFFCGSRVTTECNVLAAPNVNYPFAETSSLELYTPDFSCVVDG